MSAVLNQSWSFLELRDPQPGEKVISDHQIVQALALLKQYSTADACACVVDEGNEQPARCRRCEAQALIGYVTGESL